MKDQVSALAEVVEGVSGHDKFVLVGLLDLIHQLVDKVDTLEKQQAGARSTMEMLMKNGGVPPQNKAGANGGFSIG